MNINSKIFDLHWKLYLDLQGTEYCLGHLGQVASNSWACFPLVNLIWREDRRKQDGEQMVELHLELMVTKPVNFRTHGY